MSPKKIFLLALGIGFSFWVKSLIDVMNLETSPENPAVVEESASVIFASPADVSLPKARKISAAPEIANPNFNLAAAPDADLGPTARRAMEYLAKHKDDFRIQDYHKYRVAEVKENPLGSDVSIAFEQDGIPIVGLKLNLHFNPAGQMTDVANQYNAVPPVDTKIQANADELLRHVSHSFQTDPSSTNVPSKIIFYAAGKDEAALAYTYQVQENRANPRPADITLRANDGQLLSVSYGRKEF